MAEFLIKLAFSAFLTLVIKGVVAIAGASVAWWIAVIVALAIVFGGWFIVVHSDDWSWD
jgi:hypothetical protein